MQKGENNSKFFLKFGLDIDKNGQENFKQI